MDNCLQSETGMTKLVNLSLYSTHSGLLGHFLKQDYEMRMIVVKDECQKVIRLYSEQDGFILEIQIDKIKDILKFALNEDVSL